MADRLIEFAPTGKTFVELIVHARQAGDLDTVCTLRDRGLKTVPPEDRKAVEKAGR